MSRMNGFTVMPYCRFNRRFSVNLLPTYDLLKVIVNIYHIVHLITNQIASYTYSKCQILPILIAIASSFLEKMK